MARWFFPFTVGFLFFCIQGRANGKAESDVSMTGTTLDIPPGEDGFIVTLEVFSGVPDREWTITQNHQNFSEIRNLISSATTYKPEDAPSKLGYQGFIVQEVKNGNKQPAVLIVGPETEQLQMLLLWSIPAGNISSFINNIVTEEIRSGNVTANVSNPAKRFAPWYRPNPWNDPAHVRLNNCYNYASTIRNDTFAQPGNGGGQPFPWVFTAADVRRSAEADGCVFTAARKHMCAPRGPEHLAALFVYIGSFGCPWDCDYHWYRLDNNGYWSHKAGQTPATDRDGNGDRILDPRKAANGWIPYEFVCFMKINKDTIKVQ